VITDLVTFKRYYHGVQTRVEAAWIHAAVLWCVLDWESRGVHLHVEMVSFRGRTAAKQELSLVENPIST
jgi:hypothetical protein